MGEVILWDLSQGGKTLYLAGGVNQDNPAEEKKWGRITIYEVTQT